MPRRGVDLTEEQWSRVKAHAATRRQTISQFFADVLADILPDGTMRPATRAEIGGTIARSHMEGDVRVIDEVRLQEVSIVRDTQANRDAGAGHVPPQPRPPAVPSTGAFGSSKPAPKPKAKK